MDEKLLEQLTSLKVKFESLSIPDFDFEFDLQKKENWIQVGQNNMGSQIVVKTFPSEEENNAVFVWIDSDAAFYLPIANNFEQFVLVFPYLNGLIYDVLFKWNLNHKYPTIFPAPNASVLEGDLFNYKTENSKIFETFNELATIERNPISLILQFIEQSNGLDNWFNNFKNNVS